MTDLGAESERVGVADAKRDFSDLLGRVRHQGARFIIERRGTPMAALVPIDPPESEGDQRGFLALVGQFDDCPELPDLLDEIVASRRDQGQREAPLLE